MSIFIQFSNLTKQKLALLEKPQDFLEKSCREVREVITEEIGELLPESYRFIIWGNPMSKIQESASSFRKCAVYQRESSNEYPQDVDVYVVQIQEIDSPKLETQDFSRSVNVDEVDVREQRGGLQNSSTRPSSSHSIVGDQKGIETLLKNLEAEKTALTYRHQVAEATLSSLREKPRNRMPIGPNTAFTCSKCHYKGHRITSCRQPPCQGFYECGIASQHKDHKDNVKKAEMEVREVKKMLNDKAEEIKNTTFMKQRTKTNFFSCMRRRLQEVNPIKYSNRVELDNDLRILAAACSHKVPGEDVDLEAILANYKKRTSSVHSLSMFHGKEQRVMDSHTNMFHQMSSTKTIVSSPTINYAQTTSHYQCSSSPRYSSDVLASPTTKRRKKLTYKPFETSGVQPYPEANLGKRMSEQRNEEYEDDDETQDIPSDPENSPSFTFIKEYHNRKLAQSGLPDIGSSPEEPESQAFSYERWVAEQEYIAKNIAKE